MNVATTRAICRCINLIENCFSLKYLITAESAHAALIKAGLSRHTFLCNHLISLYSNFGAIDSCSKLFHDLRDKNVYSWNALLSAFSKIGDIKNARQLFDIMPARDTVSWNSIISGYLGVGLFEKAFEVLDAMQESSVRPSGFTLSTLASSVSSVRHAKQIHGLAIRNGFYGNSVVENSLIYMYGRLRALDYAITIFSSMGGRDIISWNELILALERSGLIIHALKFFKLMVSNRGIRPDQFTLSIVMNVCGDLGETELGEQIIGLCIKLGYLWNSVICSSIIDMYSLCGRPDCSIRFFMALAEWDPHTINSMASSYIRSGHPEEAQRMLMSAMRNGIIPSSITIIILLNTISLPSSIHTLAQVHALVLRSGMETDLVISNSLLRLYSEMGDLRSAVRIFSLKKIKDLICWNSMITGFAEHGYGLKALRSFQAMAESPNRITLRAILRACALSGYVEEGALIFSSMEEKFGVAPETEHLTYMVDMLSRAGMVGEAMEFVKMMLGKIDLGCVILLEACNSGGNLESMEEASRRGVDLGSRSSLPYTVLARIHGERGNWEGVARAWKLMGENGAKKEIECSSIAIRNEIFFFRGDQILHHGGESVYLMLKLLEIDGKFLDLVVYENTYG